MATKQALADQLAEREAQHEGLKQEIASLQEEIQLRTATAVQVETERDELRAALAMVDQSLASIQQAASLAYEQQAREREVIDAAAEEVDDLVYELYSRLKFLAISLANILAYKGDNAEVIEAIAQAAWTDVAPFIQGGEATGIFEDAFESSIEQVLTDEAEAQPDQGGPDPTPEDLAAIFGDLEAYGETCGPDCGCEPTSFDPEEALAG